MYSTYRLKANELDSKFIENLKTLFEDKEIEIAVYEVDETEYLLKSDANKRRLLEAIENVKNEKNLIEVEMMKI
ncbi:MAG: hypothetical protein HY097_00645 [Nitrospinae bacterium]|jgi:antitoxin YefM|nr:hypothetical protein [Nitrospinota bacterium]MBI3815149.1 hypothetical protein [Nitrospinota bacterium]